MRRSPRFNSKLIMLTKEAFRAIVIVSSFLIGLPLFAQESKTISIAWKPASEERAENGDLSKVLNFDHISFDENFHPRYVIRQPLSVSATSITAKLKNIITEPLSELSALRNAEKIGTDFLVDSRIVTRKKKNFTSISILPIRKTTSGYERLTSFDIDVQPSNASVGRSAPVVRTYASTSVLASGSWFRVGVTQNGVQKLDYTFLKSLGLDIDNLDPRTIQIYGNGGGILPYANNIFRYDDLQENAIIVQGESDGKFDAVDYVLFYGTPQTQWTYTNSTGQFNHKLNIYADTTYYFITVAQQNGKRINSRSSLGVTPTSTVTTYDDYGFHEVELYNLLKSGREWYGESMDLLNNVTSTTFSIPNLSVSDTVTIRTSLIGRATNSTGSNGNNFVITANGNTINTVAFSDVSTATTADYVVPISTTKSFLSNLPNITVGVNFNSSDANAQGWVNYIEMNCRKNLSAAGQGNQFNFRDSRSYATGATDEFRISGTSNNIQIWDVTDPINPIAQQYTFQNGVSSFIADAQKMREYLVYNGQQYYTPAKAGTVANQNLHGLAQTDLIIVTNPLFISAANELADFHRTHDGMRVVVATTDQVYNEFSSGAQDASAIRDFTKMFYDRATTGNEPKYLLLFGDASYDPKNRLPSNTNFLIGYESAGSINSTLSYISDDFFVLLDDNEGSWTSGELVDMSVGRIPASTSQEANALVAKIKRYVAGTGTTNPTFGNWRNIVTFVADDQDHNTHFTQADGLATTVKNNYPIYNVDKIYLDAFNQETSAGGQRYPDAHAAILDRVERGTLLITYVGHGNELNWAKERVLEINDINAWTNENHLAAFLTATCEFTRFDDPSRVSAGEWVFLNQHGGGICMYTTTRLAYSSSNDNLCRNFYTHVFDKSSGDYLTTGEIFEQTKLDVYGDVFVRNFVLLGDPAVRLAYPKMNVKTNTINGVNITQPTDTLKALSKVTITGQVEDQSGNKLTTYTGTISTTVYDKTTTYYTRGNDSADPTDPSTPAPFSLQKSIIYSGKASVINGDFSFSFIVPKDISYQIGYGKLSYYADNGTIDANGYYSLVKIGGINTNAAQDHDGPVVNLYMNDEKFVRGGLTDQNPYLYAVIIDSSGINMVGTGIGHDITAELDANTDKRYVLNEYYENDLNSYQTGKVRYQLKSLASGPHSITFKVWDVFNNSNEAKTEFVVSESAQLALDHVLNYPNPFTTKTTFMFEHNRPFIQMDVQVQIFTVSGRLVKTLSDRITPTGYRSDSIQWDGLDDFGYKIGKGVYIYKLRVKTEGGEYADKFEKLVILR